MLQFNQIISDTDILTNQNRGSCYWVGDHKGLRIYKLKKSGLEKMMEQQMYREGEWSWQRKRTKILPVSGSFL